MPEFNSRFVVQVDVENHAACRLQVVMILELLGGRKHEAVVTVFAKQPLQPPEHSRVIIDDKDDIPFPQDGYSSVCPSCLDGRYKKRSDTCQRSPKPSRSVVSATHQAIV